jgi:hypothetical protein
MLELWGQRCGDRGSEVACGREVDEVIAAGTYFLGVDGASPDSFGRFTLTWSVRELAAQAGVCTGAPRLVEGRTTKSTNVGTGDRFASSCAGDGSGQDRVFRFDLASRASVTVSAVADFDLALSLRKACSDIPAGGAELACEAQAVSLHRTSLKRTLDPGTYWIVVEGQTQPDAGAFELVYRTVSAR